MIELCAEEKRSLGTVVKAEDGHEEWFDFGPFFEFRFYRADVSVLGHSYFCTAPLRAP